MITLHIIERGGTTYGITYKALHFMVLDFYLLFHYSNFINFLVSHVNSSVDDAIMTREYAYQGQAERLIAVGRVILIAFAIYSIWHHLDGPIKYPRIAYYLLGGYLCYALVLVPAMWRWRIVGTNQAMVFHAFDLTVFGIFVFLTGGPTGSLYLFSTYCLAGAALRWQMRGAVLTLLIVLAIVIGSTLYPVNLLQNPQFNQVHFLIRLVAVAIIAAMIGCISTYERERRDELAELAAWPQLMDGDISVMMAAALKHAAHIMGAPRMLAVWEEREEPWLHTALWTGEEIKYTREAPDAFGILVAEPLAKANFFCKNLNASRPEILYTTQAKYHHWQGLPLDPKLKERFAGQTVLALVLRGEAVEGRLFALDKVRMLTADLMLGEIVARAVANDLDRFYLLKQIQQMAVTEERRRLARDLHDGLLQNLTGINLQLERVQNLLGGNPQLTQRLAESREMIAMTMRDIRTHIHQLKPIYRTQPELDGDLASHLQTMAERIKHQWGIDVELCLQLEQSKLSGGLAHEVYNIVHEAVINAARHAEASSVRAEICTRDDQVSIAVTDNGRGFPFRGRHDYGALKMMNEGPVTLMERVASLKGSLIIDSGDGGAKLEFVLPIREKMVM